MVTSSGVGLMRWPVAVERLGGLCRADMSAGFVELHISPTRYKEISKLLSPRGLPVLTARVAPVEMVLPVQHVSALVPRW